MAANQDANYGFFGPEYSFADNIALPGDIGVRQESSFDAIMDSIGGVNYYLDTIAFGGPTGFDTHQQSPMGIRFYLDTGMKCSNGATMSEYFDGVTKGDLLGDNVKRALASAGLPGLQGLAPGMLESARDALDPRPIFAAVEGTGYPVCQQVQCPVGGGDGRVTNATDPSTPFILGSWDTVNGLPMQTRWVQAYDSDGGAITVSKDEFAATPKCYNADGSYMTTPPTGCPATPPAATAAAGSGRYGLCTVTQPPTMPPTIAAQAATSESFIGSDGLTDEMRWLLGGLAVAGLAGVVAWGLTRAPRSGLR